MATGVAKPMANFARPDGTTDCIFKRFTSGPVDGRSRPRLDTEGAMVIDLMAPWLALTDGFWLPNRWRRS
jgi:hypothetical protein